MPFTEKIKTESGLLGIWKICESSSDLAANFQFSESEKEEFDRFKIDRRKIEFLAVRLLLQELLNKKVEIQYHKTGKPKLKTSKLNISISHSSKFVVILLSNKKIGIDVEDTERNIEKIATRFLHNSELKNIQNTNNQQVAKIICWGAKEAIFKCTEKQNIEFKEQILIDPFELKNKGKFTATLNKTIHYNLWYIKIENNVIVYCVE